MTCLGVYVTRVINLLKRLEWWKEFLHRLQAGIWEPAVMAQKREQTPPGPSEVISGWTV